MKRIVLWVCAVIFCFQCSSAKENGTSTKSVARVSTQDQKFADMEKALWEAWKYKDRKTYEDLLSDKFFEVDVTGTYDKATSNSPSGRDSPSAGQIECSPTSRLWSGLSRL